MGELRVLVLELDGYRFHRSSIRLVGVPRALPKRAAGVRHRALLGLPPLDEVELLEDRIEHRAASEKLHAQLPVARYPVGAKPG